MLWRFRTPNVVVVLLVLVLLQPLATNAWPQSLVQQQRLTIQSGEWMFRDHPIAYEWVQTVPSYHHHHSDTLLHPHDGTNVDTPVLLLNGFGMGSFHQHRLMEALYNVHIQHYQRSLESHSIQVSRTIYAIDYLGQGRSWPKDCNDGNAPSEQGLRYCGRTWVQQIVQFIEQVLHNQPVHIVGNSLGGHLATFIAATRPDLIASVTLLNATPVWGLNLPGWSGHLPAPRIPKWIGGFLFDRMRDTKTIQQFLSQTYVHPDAYNNAFIESIQSCTNGPGGHAAFASILFAPPIKVALPLSSMQTSTATTSAGFYECLENIQCDVLLCYGRDDPWCKPVFAKRMMQHLLQRNCTTTTTTTTTTQRYVEMANVGHCPNHEAPVATAQILYKWMEASDRRPDHLTLFPDGQRTMTISEPWGDIVVEEHGEDKIWLDGIVDKLVTHFI